MPDDEKLCTYFRWRARWSRDLLIVAVSWPCRYGDKIHRIQRCLPRSSWWREPVWSLLWIAVADAMCVEQRHEEAIARG